MESTTDGLDLFGFRFPLLLCWSMLPGSCACPANAGDVSADDFFEAKVRPVLAANCYQCHGAKKQEGDLRLDSREAAMKGDRMDR